MRLRPLYIFNYVSAEAVCRRQNRTSLSEDIPNAERVNDNDYPSKHKTFILYNICTNSAQRLPRQSNIVQMVYNCFVFAGLFWTYRSETTRKKHFSCIYICMFIYMQIIVITNAFCVHMIWCLLISYRRIIFTSYLISVFCVWETIKGNYQISRSLTYPWNIPKLFTRFIIKLCRSPSRW